LVVLAYFNGAEWIRDQIQSILSQTDVDVRIVVFDDGSTRGLTAVEALAGMAPDVEIRTRDVASGGAGQNFLRALTEIDTSECDFVAFSDQDDLWDRAKLRDAVRKLTETRSAGYSSAVRASWPNGDVKVLGQISEVTDIDFLFEGAGQGCTFVLTRTFADQLKGIISDRYRLISGAHYHDWFVYAVSRALGHRWEFDPVPSMMYRQHESNDTGARSSFSGIASRLSKIRNGWYAGQVRIIHQAVQSLDPRVIPADFEQAYQRRDGFARRIALFRLLIKRGRRRRSDRLILGASALLGWI
jgi:rhamnosyltransferase